MDASVECRPNGLFRFRLDFHGLRIGQAITKRAFLSSLNRHGIGKKAQNLEAISTHHLETLLVLSALLLGSLFREGLIRLPSRIKDPSDVKADKKKCNNRNQEVNSKTSASFGSRMIQHKASEKNHDDLWRRRLAGGFPPGRPDRNPPAGRLPHRKPKSGEATSWNSCVCSHPARD